MPDTVRTAEYFKVRVPNKPGEAARFLETLDQAKVNLLAFLGSRETDNRKWTLSPPIRLPLRPRPGRPSGRFRVPKSAS